MIRVRPTNISKDKLRCVEVWEGSPEEDLQRFFAKTINYAIKLINNAEDILLLIQYMMEPNSFFDKKIKPKKLTTKETT